MNTLIASSTTQGTLRAPPEASSPPTRERFQPSQDLIHEFSKSIDWKYSFESCVACASSEHNSATIRTRERHGSTSVPCGDVACSGGNHPPAAWAQDSYPSRPVKVVVGFPAGSATDVATRAVAEALASRLGQPFIVDNRPGAASNIAAKAVATSPPDGYTIFVGTVANTINAAFPDADVARPRKGVRRGHDDWQRAEHAGRASVARREVGGPADPRREGEAGPDRLCLVGQRHLASSVR